eukprot:6982372-Pyramimonas_sp.AAC.1
MKELADKIKLRDAAKAAQAEKQEGRRAAKGIIASLLLCWALAVQLTVDMERAALKKYGRCLLRRPHIQYVGVVAADMGMGTA